MNEVLSRSFFRLLTFESAFGPPSPSLPIIIIVIVVDVVASVVVVDVDVVIFRGSSYRIFDDKVAGKDNKDFQTSDNDPFQKGS